jgi:parallel beta-helix repeat protein
MNTLSIVVKVLMAVGMAAFAVALVAAPATADYTTPGTGVDWTLDDLVVNSGGAVTGGDGAYEVHQTVIIAASDRLTIAAGAHLTFLDAAGTMGLTVRGALSAIGTEQEPIVFDSAIATPGAWRGLLYSDTQAGSEFHLAGCEVAHANTAIDIVGADVLVERCDLHDTLDKAVDFSAASGVVRDCRIHDNRRRTIVMTLSSSPLIENCRIENNNIDNTSPYPYINIGLQGVNSPTIRGCTILGSGHHMSGGIAIWNAGNGLIEGNHIEGCGYGILCYQTAASPMIRNNTLLANNIHPDTVNWGFGVACNGNNAPILAGNTIRGHWYGVAAINGGRPNLGNLGNASPDDDGGNHITGNGLNGQIYGFYNNTPLSQSAQGNWWGGTTAQEVEDAIWHRLDDPALGLVDYSQWLMVDAVDDWRDETPIGGRIVLSSIRVHPNPNSARGTIEYRLLRASAVRVVVIDLTGRVVREIPLGARSVGAHQLEWDGVDGAGRVLPSGVYFCRITAGEESITARFVLLR